MGVITVGEFEADVVNVMARVTAGESLDITQDGRVVAEVRPKRVNKLDDPVFRAAYERLMNGLKTSVPGFDGPATYEKRTGR